MIVEVEPTPEQIAEAKLYDPDHNGLVCKTAYKNGTETNAGARMGEILFRDYMGEMVVFYGATDFDFWHKILKKTIDVKTYSTTCHYLHRNISPCSQVMRKIVNGKSCDIYVFCWTLTNLKRGALFGWISKADLLRFAWKIDAGINYGQWFPGLPKKAMPQAGYFINRSKLNPIEGLKICLN